MSGIVAVDPGSERSGWVLLRLDERVEAHGVSDNEWLLEQLRGGYPLSGWSLDALVIEWTRPRGMPASSQLFEALWWAGRFAEAVYPLPVERIQRADVKLHMCGVASARDQNVVAAIIDRYGGTGGKVAAVGTVRAPGPLHGVRRDAWQALALGLTWLDGSR